jgi:hypothetical protein
VLLAVSLREVRYQGLLAAAFFAVVWAGVHQLRYAEFGVAGRVLFGGDLYRTMNFRMRLAAIGKDLRAAATEEDWWTAMVNGARTLGLSSVHLDVQGGRREAVLSKVSETAWSFCIPLSGGASLELSGALDEDAASVDLQAIARAVTGTFPVARAPVEMAKRTAASG